MNWSVVMLWYAGLRACFSVSQLMGQLMGSVPKKGYNINVVCYQFIELQ